jgi:hypothetical protein
LSQDGCASRGDAWRQSNPRVVVTTIALAAQQSRRAREAQNRPSIRPCWSSRIACAAGTFGNPGIV